MVADWLRVEVASGLQKLLALRLPGTPPEDAIIGTAEVWLEAMNDCGIQWAEHLDRERVQRAFRSLFRICDRWPAPRLFLDNLGNRDPPPALPPPRLTREEMERNRARLRELVAGLVKSKTMSQKGETHERNSGRVLEGRQGVPGAGKHDQAD